MQYRQVDRFNWLAPLIDEGVLAWCNEQGADFPNTGELKKAKRAGKAYLRIVNRIGLPTPFELTDDPSWGEGGGLFQLYDLHLNDDDYVTNREDSIAVSLLAENEGMWVGNPSLALLEYDEDQDVQHDPLIRSITTLHTHRIRASAVLTSALMDAVGAPLRPFCWSGI